MHSLFILGRQPAIGRAELERLFDTEVLEPVGETAMLCRLLAAEVDFARIGGSIKLCEVLEIVHSTDWRTVQTALIQAGLQAVGRVGDGKLHIGLSAYDLHVTTRQLTAGGLEFKKALRQTGRSVRLVPNQELALNSAQVLYNHLTDERGLELVLVRHGAQTIVARTVAEQDITAYARRDQGRPKRDARVGMLPPKLAQIIVNLAIGAAVPSPDFTVLDPFCGTGVVLQEALLMGFSAYGSDLEQRMVDYSSANVQEWLRRVENPDLPGISTIAQGDATSQQWLINEYDKHNAQTTWRPAQIDAVACETYLGHPFTSLPSPDKLATVRQTCNIIIEKFLRNIAVQIPAGTPLCLAVPAWQTKPDQFTHLPLLDRLSDLGYNRIDFKYARPSELVYHRPDQIVGRELMVITRK